MTFTYILWTSIFTINMHYFYHQTHHLNKGEAILFVLILNAWHHLEVFIMRLMPGALDKETNFNRTMFRCDPRKNGRPTKVNGDIFSCKRCKCWEKSCKGCLERRTYLKVSKHFRLRDTSHSHVLRWLATTAFVISSSSVTFTLGYLLPKVDAGLSSQNDSSICKF